MKAEIKKRFVIGGVRYLNSPYNDLILIFVIRKLCVL